MSLAFFPSEVTPMLRFITACTLVVLATAQVHAHFVFVVPAPDGKSVKVVFSDNLSPDENVDINKVASLKLTGRFTNGKEAAIESKVDKHHLAADIKLADPLCVYGSVTYGLMTRKDTKPALLIYHPKAIFAGSDLKSATIGEKAALEIVTVTESGKTRFRLLAQGKPVADAEGSILLPDDKKEKLKTDNDGYTPAFEAPGRYAVWLKNIETKAGEHDGKKYEEVRHYATLVADIGAKRK